MSNKIFTNTRNIIYKALSSFDWFTRNQNKIVILCYHAIDENIRFSTSLFDFKRQVELISKTHTPISLSELISKIERGDLSEKYFVLTFDDGYKSILKAKKYLDSRGIKPTVNLIFDKENVRNHQSNIFLTQNDILSLIKAGWEIGSHTKTHRLLSQLNQSDIKREIKRKSSRYKTIAYPLGRYDQRVLKLVRKEGYQYGLTMDDGFIDKNTNLLLLPRIGVDATHRVSEFESLYSPSVVNFRKFLKTSKFKDWFINI